MNSWRERDRFAVEQARRWPVGFFLNFLFSILGAIYIAQNVAGMSAENFPDVIAKAALGAAIFTAVMRSRKVASGPAAPAA